jgi:putative ABC transport system substrate-binding protein
LRRRGFFSGSVAAVAVGSTAEVAWAQSGARRLIGVLSGYADSDPEGQLLLATFRQELERLGWIDERNIRFEYRRSVAGADMAEAQAAELAGLKPDVILTTGGTALVSQMRQTRTVPIVFVTDTDPVALGLIASLARPGGNATGFVSFDPAMGSKWLQILKEFAPGLARVGILPSPNPQATVTLPVIEAVAPSFGLRSAAAVVREAADIERASAELAREPGTGLVVLSGATALRHRDLIVALAARYRLPALYTNAAFARGGGLVSYGIDRREPLKQAAGYVDRILKGERPANLPVQTPTAFELVINLRTATALGLSPPTHLRALASEMIE